LDEIPKPPPGGPSFWDLLREVDDGPEPPGEPGQPGEPKTPPPCALKFDPQWVFWAMRNLPLREACKHLLVCGATGSGKTIAIQLFLQSIAPRFRERKLKKDEVPEQLILFDAKSDLIPLLDLLGHGTANNNVFLLNPYDARSAVWNLAEAVQTPVMARALATLLVPEEKHSSAPYFSDAARELVYAVLLGLNQIKGETWTFRDLLCALDSRAHIAGVSAQDPRGKILAERILLDDRHSNGVLSTLGTRLGAFEQVAALWQTNTSGRTFSIKKFLERPGVLVLGNDPVLRASFWPINALLLKALAHELLRRPDTGAPHEPRHWFVLDEFRAMERVDCIHELLNRGRSKGVSILLGLQSVEGLVQVYGRQDAEDLLSQCANKTFLRAGGPETAGWAERFFGQVRHLERSTSHTTGMSGWSHTEQYSLHDRSLFVASFFLDIPFPGPGKLYAAVCDVPSLGETRIVHCAFDEVIQWCRQLPKDGGVLPVEPREDVAGQRLSSWTSKEEIEFHATPHPEAAPPEDAPQPPAPKPPPLPRRHVV
jgi:type IV secretory pathway TraG/TraD family ATPase VirD4